MDLSERKRRILGAIIDDYVNTAEPVGSRTLVKRHDLGLSSATIRNEMADLEDLGYLSQPHTSSGRIPSLMGYRFYVDELMSRYTFTLNEIELIRRSLQSKILELDNILQQASKAVSRFTNHVTVAIAPEIEKGRIRHLELFPVGLNNILFIIVTDSGVVKNKLIPKNSMVEDEFIYRLSEILNERLVGLSIDDLTQTIIDDIMKEMQTNQPLLFPILSFIYETIENLDGSEIYTEGASNLLNYPEYNDASKAKSILALLEQKNEVAKLITSNISHGIKIIIGEESGIEALKDSSIVLSTCSAGGQAFGAIGIIGPVRMDYPKVVSTLECFTNSLNIILNEIYKN